MVNYSRDLEISPIETSEFSTELIQMTNHLFSFKSFPTQNIKQVWRLFDPESLGPFANNELPIAWYYGAGENWHFCAFWHDN